MFTNIFYLYQDGFIQTSNKIICLSIKELFLEIEFVRALICFFGLITLAKKEKQ